MSLCEVPGYSGGAWHGLFLMAIVSSETKDCWATPRRTLTPHLSINFSQDILKMIFLRWVCVQPSCSLAFRVISHPEERRTQL